MLSISIAKIYLRSCSNLLIFTNPRNLPPRNESTRAPSCTISIIKPSVLPPPQKKKKFEWNRTNDVEKEHLHFHIIERKNGGCKNPQLMESCLSSRTLLFTTSFQTKFYHNIPLVWSWHVIDSILKS